MLIEPTVNIPPLIEQGDCPSWVDQPFTDDLGNTFDASGFSLVYTLAGATTPLTLTGSTTGTGWTTTISTTQSTGLAPGTYWWQTKLTATNFALTVARGELVVTPNLALQAAGYSGLSPAEQALNAARAQLSAATATESYKIGTREMRYRMTKDIMDLISYWNGVVVNERVANSLSQNQGNPRKVYARFPGKFGFRS